MNDIKVLEIDQWAVRGTEGQPFEGYARASVVAGDAAAINRMGLGTGNYRLVQQNDDPPLGTAWMVNVDGKAMLWKAHYDTSD